MKATANQSFPQLRVLWELLVLLTLQTRVQELLGGLKAFFRLRHASIRVDAVTQILQIKIFWNIVQWLPIPTVPLLVPKPLAYV